MPIFEFHCQKCERDSEILVRSKGWKGAVCPYCGSKKLTKKFSVFASASAGASTTAAPACGANPRSCCACGTGRPHRH